MSKFLQKKGRRFSALTLIVGAAILAFFSLVDSSRSANPTSGALTGPAGSPVTWDGTAAGGASLDESTCTPATCDAFTLNLSGDFSGKQAHIVISWVDSTATEDYDVFVHKGSVTGPVVGSSAKSGSGPEIVDLDPNIPSIGTGTFTVNVVYFSATPAPPLAGQYHGNASIISGGITPTPTPSPDATPTPTPGSPNTPRYHNFVAPPGFGEDSGEPSIGSNWLSENVVRPGSGHTFSNSLNPMILNGGTETYYGGFLTEMLRITFDDCSSPANAFWEKKPVTLAATPRALGDPILFTDHGYPALIGPGRTFVSQEEAQAGSTTDVTDNDGDTFMPSQGAGAPAGVDHQTVGAGPYSSTGIIPPSSTPYPASGPRRAVYYASQSVSDARTSRSDDGGITFGPAVPMYTTVDCGGLHGHLKVAPDGTVYVPNNACGGTDQPGHLDGQQAAIVSVDNGVTWAIRKIPGTDTKSDRDPSIGIATDGTIYMGMQSKDGHARISVSHDRGLNWDTFPGQLQPKAYDVGAQLGIQNMVFAEVAAGDPDRAAFAFFGTTTGGDNYDAPEFPGVWYLYISTTFDGGQTWKTVNATPNDPIQRGGICGSGTCRNLLDFFDATIDKEGRILIGGEDGCVGGCVNGGSNSFTAKAFITRQSGGPRMFAAKDSQANCVGSPPVCTPTLPGAPAVSGTLAGSTVKLTWPVPDNGGAEIISYRVFKGSGATFNPIATVTVPNYTDPAFSTGEKYRVTAVNSAGEGPFCHEFAPVSGPVVSACSLPGVLVINDQMPNGADNDSGQNTPADPRVNIKQLFVAEPFVNSSTEQLFFTLEVAPSAAGSAPPNSQYLIIWNRQGTPGSADPGDPNDSKYDRIYLAMVTDANGTPTFEYGKFGIPINTSPPPLPDPSANAPKKAGAADSGSYDPLTGLIKITLSNSKLRAIDGGAGKYIAGTDLAGINVRTYFNRADYISDPNAMVRSQRSQNNASDITDNSNYSIVGNSSCAPAATGLFVSAVSRKLHNGAPFDVRLLPADGKNGIECRSGGGTGPNAGSYQVVMTFAAPVTYTGATATNGASASPNPAAGSPPTTQVTVNLTNVPNTTTTMVNLAGVTGTGGAGDTISVPLAVLIGDVNASRVVTTSDTNLTKARALKPVDDDNFRSDIDASGAITTTDVNLIKSRALNKLQ